LGPAKAKGWENGGNEKVKELHLGLAGVKFARAKSEQNGSFRSPTTDRTLIAA
jgi:hypothetical protein